MTMTETRSAESALEAIRQEIDGIDAALLALLERRYAATARVRDIKEQDGTLGLSPFRPAREASILRLLLAADSAHVDPELVVRLWRNIVVRSSQNQAPVTIHVSKRLSSTMGLRLRIRDYYGTIPVEDYRDEAQALMQVNASPGDIAIIETDSPWVEAFANGMAGQARVMACLPFLREDVMPRLLVFGHAPSEPTGDDETLLISNGRLPRDFAPLPLWELKVGTRRLTCLPGYLPEHEAPMIGLVRSNAQLGLKIIGHYPSPYELKTP
jgi:chorismate mutase